MAFTYDIALGTPKDAVRILLADTNGTAYSYEDEEIQGVLNLFAAGQNPYRAAAMLLESSATNQALLLKKISGAELTTDGPAVQKQLMAQAQQWRDEADRLDVQTMGGFDYAEQWVTIFNWRERFLDQALRLNPS